MASMACGCCARAGRRPTPSPSSSAQDIDPEVRQVGIVDAAGGSAAHTGIRCVRFASAPRRSGRDGAGQHDGAADGAGRDAGDVPRDRRSPRPPAVRRAPGGGAGGRRRAGPAVGGARRGAPGRLEPAAAPAWAARCRRPGSGPSRGPETWTSGSTITHRRWTSWAGCWTSTKPTTRWTRPSRPPCAVTRRVPRRPHSSPSRWHTATTRWCCGARSGSSRAGRIDDARAALAVALAAEPRSVEHLRRFHEAGHLPGGEATLRALGIERT